MLAARCRVHDGACLRLLALQPLQLKFVKFQCVRSLTLFVESNQDGEETTKLSKLVLMGTP